VEVKTTEHLLPVHQAQVLTYMKLLKLPHGLLINFNVPRLIDGLRSLVLDAGRPGGTLVEPGSVRPNRQQGSDR
jgi:hypothetical protein